MNRAVHVAPKTGKEDPATELAQPAGERAETQVTSKKAGDQHNCLVATTHVRKETVEKPVEREKQVFTEEAIFAQQFCEAWTEFGFQKKHRPVPLDALDAAARLGFHMTLEVVEFVRVEDSPAQGLRRAGSLADSSRNRWQSSRVSVEITDSGVLYGTANDRGDA